MGEPRTCSRRTPTNQNLQTEGIGLLSAIVFLQHYTLFHNIKIEDDKMLHYCNNMGVVKQMGWAEMTSV
eukprot:11617261-Ditylum_brightwellii.AAC.1